MNKMSLSDEELVEVVRTKDQEVYEELVRRYEKQLLRYANYLIRDDQKAADIVQESFVKAYVNLRGFDVKRKFSSWIYRIVHNETMNLMRKNKREVPLEAFKWSEYFFGERDNTDVELDKKQAAKMLRDSLEELPLKYRSPLTLFYLEDKTYEEISDVLRIPIGTVGTHINRGKKFIRKILEKKGGKEYVD
jgi:RNA polymerase sigma-70 factor, ECF subfamily